MRLGHRDLVADGPGRDPQAGQPADLAQRRAAGQEDALGVDRARGRLDADDPAALEPDARDGGPLAQLDAHPLHRQRIGPDVARRIDRTVGLEVAPATVAVGTEGRVDPAGLGRAQPAHRQPLALLHRDPGPTIALVASGDRDDQVAELAEARVGPVAGG